HDLFYSAALPSWLTARQRSAITRARHCAAAALGWKLSDTLGQRAGDILGQLQKEIFISGNQVSNHLGTWNSFVSSLPSGITLEEVLEFLTADTESDQQIVLDGVRVRLGIAQEKGDTIEKKIRILTMHGAKGLSGKVVFLPSIEQGIM